MKFLAQILTISLIVGILFSAVAVSTSGAGSVVVTTTTTESISSESGNPTHSPLFLGNLSTYLVIPVGFTFTLANSGYGGANYGTIDNLGTLVLANTLINYGTILNVGVINVTKGLVNMNQSDSTVLTTGIIHNTGTINVLGYLYNGNSFVNLGNVVNSGSIFNCISGLRYNGTITGTPIAGVSSLC